MKTMLQEKRPRQSYNRKKRWTRLEYIDPTAKSVCIAGTFNDWRPEATPMIRMGDGYWVKDLSLPPGNYEYRLVVDASFAHILVNFCKFAEQAAIPEKT